jgi:hypothetical protein
MLGASVPTVCRLSKLAAQRNRTLYQNSGVRVVVAAALADQVNVVHALVAEVRSCGVRVITPSFVFSLGSVSCSEVGCSCHLLAASSEEPLSVSPPAAFSATFPQVPRSGILSAGMSPAFPVTNRTCLTHWAVTGCARVRAAAASGSSVRAARNLMIPSARVPHPAILHLLPARSPASCRLPRHAPGYPQPQPHRGLPTTARPLAPQPYVQRPTAAQLAHACYPLTQLCACTALWAG